MLFFTRAGGPRQRARRRWLGICLGAALSYALWSSQSGPWSAADSGRAGGEFARAGTRTSRDPEPPNAAARSAASPSATAPGGTLAALPAPAPPTAPSDACPAEMVLVSGDYCSQVQQICTRWLDDQTLPFARCAEYARPSRCTGTRSFLRFCIDRYEYTPQGERFPQNYASFVEATRVCESLGKRVCTESEWNFACEGPEMLPYPYGYVRLPLCNQDRADLYEPNPHRQVLRDLRAAAGAHPECRSPFGVYDMAGNVDEPVLREGMRYAYPYRNALKGGWWMAARNRCRPATTAHDDHYRDIQVGIRCCSDASG